MIGNGYRNRLNIILIFIRSPVIVTRPFEKLGIPQYLNAATADETADLFND